MMRMLAIAGVVVALTQAGPRAHRISGRVQDAHGQRAASVTLRVCKPEGKNRSSRDGRLEYMFTQRPARVTGRVTDAKGAGVAGAWVMVFSVDRRLWIDWASTTTKTQAVANGAFSSVVRPGGYFVAALPATPYQVQPVWPSVAALAGAASEVTVGDRGRAEVTVQLSAR